MRKRLGLVLGLLMSIGWWGCGASEDAAGASMACADNFSTILLSVMPTSVVRGDPTSITIEWEVEQPLTDPVVATMMIGLEPTLEVEVLLDRVPDRVPFLYQGAQTNPFGVAAPAGSVAVVTTGGLAGDCRTTPTAATSFSLE